MTSAANTGHEDWCIGWRVGKYGGTWRHIGHCDCEGEETMKDYTELRRRLERLNDPEARFEMGEASRNAALAAAADEHLLPLLDEVERLRGLLVPRAVPREHATADDPQGVFGAPGMMGG